MKDIKNLIIAIMGIIIVVLFLDEYCVINIIESNCEVKSECDTLGILSSVGGYCIDTGRYQYNGPHISSDEGGKTISQQDANAYIDSFKVQLSRLRSSDPDFRLPQNKGVFLSKKAFEDIFNKEVKSNGITCYFAIDENNQFNLVYDGSRSNATQIVASPTNMDPVFISTTLCPDECGNIIGK